MLYALHELHKRMTAPLAAWADANHRLFTNPYSPLAYHPLSRTIAASHEMLARLTRSYDKPAWDIDHAVVKGQTVPVSIEPAMRKPFCVLQHFKKEVEDRGPQMLIFAPLSGHHATLLRDTVKAALQDFDVYITDWVDARMVPLAEGPFHLDDYVDYCMQFIRLLGGPWRGPGGVHVVSVCQPTVPVLAAVSLLAQSGEATLPKAMVMMGGPIDPRRNPTVVNEFAMGRSHAWFEGKVIDRVPFNYPGYMRRVYPGFLQHLGFLAMNADRHIDAHRKFFNHLVVGDGDSAAAHRRFYDEYNAVLDMPAEYYLDTIKTVFQDFALPKGRMTVRGELVRPAAIKSSALFTIEGELDDISGNGQTEAAHILCRNIPSEKRKHLLAQRVGHYGIFSGRKFRERIYPQIRDFVRRWH
ncbi:MAG TPA: polyhydroxyalkanoate depolymerase [Burkholderiales bacterium]|nr:polyhydroxyalkanoate depolymerase [Burkholderiales bacterium]